MSDTEYTDRISDRMGIWFNQTDNNYKLHWGNRFPVPSGVGEPLTKTYETLEDLAEALRGYLAEKMEVRNGSDYNEITITSDGKHIEFNRLLSTLELTRLEHLIKNPDENRNKTGGC